MTDEFIRKISSLVLDNKKMKKKSETFLSLDYSKLTRESLESLIEFIDDWAKVPYELIDKELGEKFLFIEGLQQRIHIEESYKKMEKVIDEEKFPNRIFFFVGDQWYMDLDTKSGILCYSVERLWDTTVEEIGYSSFSMNDAFDTARIQLAMRNMNEERFGMTIVPNMIHSAQIYSKIEQHLNNIRHGNHKS